MVAAQHFLLSNKKQKSKTNMKVTRVFEKKKLNPINWPKRKKLMIINIAAVIITDKTSLVCSIVGKKTHRHFFCPSDPQSCHNPGRCTSSECSAWGCPSLRSAAITRRKRSLFIYFIKGVPINYLFILRQGTYVWCWSARSWLLAPRLAAPKLHDEEQSHQEQTPFHFLRSTCARVFTVIRFLFGIFVLKK